MLQGRRGQPSSAGCSTGSSVPPPASRSWPTGLAAFVPTDAPASPILDAKASDLDVPDPPTSPSRWPACSRRTPSGRSTSSPWNSRAVFAATEDALPHPLLKDLGRVQEAHGGAEALAH